MNTLNNEVQTDAVKPTITFLNMTGDITISWDAANEETVLALVEQKMKEGCSFFILKPRLFGLLGHAKKRASTIEEVAKVGSVMVEDAEAKRILEKSRVNDAAVESALASGQVQLVSSEKPVDIETVRRAKSAQEVVQHQTVAVRRVVGG